MGMLNFECTRRIMESTNTQFESLLDQVEQLHQAIASGDTNMGTLAQLLRDRLNRPEQLSAWFDQVEPLRWWRVSQQLPPFDLDVLVSWGDGRGTYIGALLEREGWVGGDAMPFDSAPRYWCAMPIGPIDQDAKS
jgi:hypothetical protein